MKIAFGYRMGSGKDTAVKYMIEKTGGNHISFAEPIYSIMNYAQKTCGFPKEKDRKFLQWIGTEWAREKDSNIWINLALNSASQEGNHFISDVRFKNEFDALKANDWICVKLDRIMPDQGREGTGTKLHVSEYSLDIVHDLCWDYIITNNGTLDELYKKLDVIIENNM